MGLISAHAKCPKKPASKIEHLIVIISENHSFDSYFGGYCKAPAYSAPDCNYGVDCCEAAPETVNGKKPYILSDVQNIQFDPNHSQAQELCKQNFGQMNKYMTGQGCTSSDDRNFAVADNVTVATYIHYAQNYAISDRYFQSAAGASSENDMYFARGEYVFLDNTKAPISSKSGAYPASMLITYHDKTIADLLVDCGISWSFYAEGYNVPIGPGDDWPFFYDPTDNPFEYYASLVDNPNYFKDFTQFDVDVKEGKLPAVSYFKAQGIRSEHPTVSAISGGEVFNSLIVDTIFSNPKYKDNTLILMTPDESGGFYDHVSPPPDSVVDGQTYGPRTFLVAVGAMTKKNYISHVQAEPSSIIKFIEWNWLGQTGQVSGLRSRI